MVSKPPSRPKGWRREQRPQAATPESAKTDELPTHAAPGHMGAQVSESRYTQGRGVFGFRQDIEESWGGKTGD